MLFTKSLPFDILLIILYVSGAMYTEYFFASRTTVIEAKMNSEGAKQ